MKGLLNSFAAAVKGIRVATKSERNMRIHVAATLIVVSVGTLVGLSLSDWGLVAAAIGLVLVAELMNTAVESLVNLVEPRHNPIAGKIKDIAAGGVLVAATIALIIGFTVFYKYIPL